MTRKSGAGFTVIELLIVVAIIAVICAASSSTVIAPMFERVRAEDQESFEVGSGALIAALVQDAHRAASLDSSTSGSFVFTINATPPATIVYALQKDGILTRKAGDHPEARLLSSIRGFYAGKETSGSLTTIVIEGTLKGYRGKMDPVERKVTVTVGPDAWMGSRL